MDAPVPARWGQVAAQETEIGESRFVPRRVRRMLIAFGTSLALVLGVLGIFGVGSASASTRSRLAVSLSPDRSHAVRLDGITVQGKIYVFVRNSRGLRKVDFYLDDPRQTRAPARTDRVPPFDLAGTARNRTARPFDTTKLVDGSHMIKVVLTWRGGRTSSRRATFTVDNENAMPAPTASTSSGSASATVTKTPSAPTSSTATHSASASQSSSATHSASASSSGSASTSQSATTSSSPSGSPTATTVTPTPPAATLPAGNVCTNPVWRSSSNGAMYSDGGFIIHNNMWNTSGYRVSETVEVCSYHSWNAIATADNSSGDGAVKTYANVHKDYHNWSTGYEPPLSNYPTLSSSFAAAGPNTGIYNFAYDIWLNGVGNGGGSNREVMIWTDNQAQRPAGSVVATGIGFGGQTWTLWATGDNHILSFVPSSDMASGTVNIRAMLDYLISHGRVPANSTLGQIGYGVEIVSTNGAPGTFRFTGFSLRDR
jgi:Glycosyl hydrolase family 12